MIKRAAFVTAFLTSSAAFAASYTISPLSPLPSYPYAYQLHVSPTATGGSVLFADPNLGQLEQPVLWQPGSSTPTTLPLGANYLYGSVYGISATGDELGTVWVDFAPSNRPAIWQNGQLTILPTTDLLPAGTVYAENNQNIFVGSITNGENGRGTETQAALWSQGNLTLLAPTSTRSNAVAINNNNQVLLSVYGTGEFSLTSGLYLWSNNTLSRVPTSTDNEDLLGVAIADNGDFIGNSEFGPSGGPYSTPFFSHNRIISYLTGLPGDSQPSVSDMNNLDQIVGSDLSSSDSLYHALLWQNGNPIDLNSLLPANSGWTLTDALSIDDNGDIVGQGTFNGTPTAFLLTATPEPTSLSLLALATLPLLIRRRK